MPGSATGMDRGCTGSGAAIALERAPYARRPLTERGDFSAVYGTTGVTDHLYVA
jgi:hypothetical protein